MDTPEQRIDMDETTQVMITLLRQQVADLQWQLLQHEARAIVAHNAEAQAAEDAAASPAKG